MDQATFNTLTQGSIIALRGKTDTVVAVETRYPMYGPQIKTVTAIFTAGFQSLYPGDACFKEAVKVQ